MRLAAYVTLRVMRLCQVAHAGWEHLRFCRLSWHASVLYSACLTIIVLSHLGFQTLSTLTFTWEV